MEPSILSLILQDIDTRELSYEGRVTAAGFAAVVEVLRQIRDATASVQRRDMQWEQAFKDSLPANSLIPHTPSGVAQALQQLRYDIEAETK